MNNKTIIVIIAGIVIITAISIGYYFGIFIPKKELPAEIKQQQTESINPSYNQIMSAAKKRDGSAKVFFGETIKWQAKISAYYSQLDGIKFCVIDEDHQNVDIDKSCDWFWAYSKDLSGANDLKINPAWNGRWVPYALKHYNVPFDENSRYYDEIYTIEGNIKGAGCDSEPDLEFPDYNCIMDIDIINIIK